MANGSDTIDQAREQRVAEVIGADAARRMFSPTAAEVAEDRELAQRIVGSTDVQLAALSGASDPEVLVWLRDLFADEAAGGAR